LRAKPGMFSRCLWRQTIPAPCSTSARRRPQL
jgi:hypothetical protein